MQRKEKGYRNNQIAPVTKKGFATPQTSGKSIKKLKKKIAKFTMQKS